MKRRFCFAAAAAALLFALLTSGAAFAGNDCRPLTLITSIDMLPVDRQSAVLVHAKIDGDDQIMLLDTGGVFSEITQKTATKLNLDERESALMLVGVTGDKTNTVAHAHSFQLGGLKANAVDFMVTGSHDGAAFTGTIAPNLLTRYDVEFDFAADKVNLLSPDHCPGKVIYWPANAATVVPIRVTKAGHIFVPVVLDGVQMEGMVDTGSSLTTLSLPTAEQDFDIKVGSTDTPADGHLGDTANARTYHHRFHTLTIGGIGVGNPTIELLPDLMNNQLSHAPPLGSRLSEADEANRLPDLIVGMDVLHHLHLYVAYAEEKLYVTPAAASLSASVQ